MFSLGSDFPPQAFFYPNFHYSSPCSSSFNDDPTNPFHFNHQSYYLPNQMGIFYQDPNLNPPNNDHHHHNTIHFPSYNPTALYDQSTLGLSSPKKDRHTKISTAHGFRDRRVRLSMAIAREFFDLQDMLGFDKASKTIGWLLAKSKNAIQDLALAKNGGCGSRSNSTSCSSHQEQVFTKRRRKCSSSTNFSSKEEVENQANVFIAKENRAKARARARERTKGKLSTLIKPIQFDDLGFQTGSSSSQFLTVLKAQDFPSSNYLTEEEQGFSAPLHNSPPTDDLVRVDNHLPGLLFGSDYYTDQAMYSSFSGLNMLPHFYN